MAENIFDVLESMRDQETICIYVPNLKKGKIIVFEPGAGTALDNDDYAKGYVDYVNWTSYDLAFDGELTLEEFDGGIWTLKQDYCDTSMQHIVGCFFEDDDPKNFEGITVLDFEDLIIS